MGDTKFFVDFKFALKIKKWRHPKYKIISLTSSSTTNLIIEISASSRVCVCVRQPSVFVIVVVQNDGYLISSLTSSFTTNLKIEISASSSACVCVCLERFTTSLYNIHHNAVSPIMNIWRADVTLFEPPYLPTPHPLHAISSYLGASGTVNRLAPPTAQKPKKLEMTPFRLTSSKTNKKFEISALTCVGLHCLKTPNDHSQKSHKSTLQFLTSPFLRLYNVTKPQPLHNGNTWDPAGTSVFLSFSAKECNSISFAWRKPSLSVEEEFIAWCQ